MNRELKLVLKGKWFNMILSGEKKEEYRELKPFWEKRLKEKEFDRVVFYHGYRSDRPYMVLECLGIEAGSGKENWGANPGQKYYVIKLGNILSKSEIFQP